MGFVDPGPPPKHVLQSGGRASKPEFSLDVELGAGFFEELAGRGGRSILMDAEWALSTAAQFRAFKKRLSRGFESAGAVNREELESLKALLLTAPSSKAFFMLCELDANPKDEGQRLRQILVKEDADEGAKRERDAGRRFGVIERLAEAGRPLPPWLTQFGELIDA